MPCSARGNLPEPVWQALTRWSLRSAALSSDWNVVLACAERVVCFAHIK